MAIGCGAKFSKYTVFLFNILFWITGLIFIVLGSIYLTTGGFKSFEEVITPNDRYFTRLMYCIIGLGCIVFVVGFCGCCGAIRESRLLLGTYIVLLLLIMIVEISCGIYATVKEKEVVRKIEKSLEKSIIKNYPPFNSTSNQNLKNAIDYIQKTFRCCGVKTYKNWENSTWYISRNDSFMETPSSCCESDIESELRSCFNEQKYYKMGCSDRLRNYLKYKMPIIVGVLIGIALFEILLVVFAVCLCNNTGNTQHSTV